MSSTSSEVIPIYYFSQAKDKQGLQPLHNACIYGFPDIVQLLIERKVNLRARDVRKQTPLHRAALAGRPEIVDILLSTGESLHGPAYKSQVSHILINNLAKRINDEYSKKKKKTAHISELWMRMTPGGKVDFYIWV